MTVQDLFLHSEPDPEKQKINIQHNIFLQSLGDIIYESYQSNTIEAIEISDEKALDFLVGAFLNNRDNLYESGFSQDYIDEYITTNNSRSNSISDFIRHKKIDRDTLLSENYYILTKNLLENLAQEREVAEDLNDYPEDELWLDEESHKTLYNPRKRIIDELFSEVISELDRMIDINEIVFPNNLGTLEINNCFATEELFELKSEEIDPDLPEVLAENIRKDYRVRSLLGFIEILRWAYYSEISVEDKLRIHNCIYKNDTFTINSDISRNLFD